MSGRFQRGDILEFHRGLYSHHGVAVNDSEVVHVDKPDKCTTINIRKQNIEEVAAGSKVTSYYPEKATFSREETARRAEMAIGKPHDYDLTHNNCEHFATLMATGKPYSTQVKQVALNAVIAAAGEDDKITQADVKRLVDETHTKK